MRKMMNKVAGNMKVTVARAAMLLKDKKGENYVDTAVKILPPQSGRERRCPGPTGQICRPTH